MYEVAGAKLLWEILVWGMLETAPKPVHEK